MDTKILINNIFSIAVKQVPDCSITLEIQDGEHVPVIDPFGARFKVACIKSTSRNNQIYGFVILINYVDIQDILEHGTYNRSESMLKDIGILYNSKSIIAFIILHEIGHALLYKKFSDIGKLKVVRQVIDIQRSTLPLLKISNLSKREEFRNKGDLSECQSLNAEELYADNFAMRKIRIVYEEISKLDWSE
jgi:hypothetical protein